MRIERLWLVLFALALALVAQIAVLPAVSADDGDEGYIVTELWAGVLAHVSLDGTKTSILTFDPETFPTHVAIDGEGRYIVAETFADVVSRITPTVRGQLSTSSIRKPDLLAWPSMGLATTSSLSGLLTGCHASLLRG